MPLSLSKGSRKTAFIVISLLLPPALAASAGENFEAGLEEGRRHGAEILSRHSEILRPSAATPEAVPGYGEQTRQELSDEGSRWTEDPEGMRTEAESAIESGDQATSDAPGFLKQSSAQRPTFTIDPETDPMIRNSRDAMENTAPQCEKKEVCTEYAESSWNEQEECYDQATLQRVSCSVTKTVTATERTENWKYVTLEIDRNDGGVGFSASIDTDGDGSRDVSLSSPGCLDRRSGDVWGDFGGFTLGGSYWRGCFTLDGSGSFVPEPSSTCVSVFGPTASTGPSPGIAAKAVRSWSLVSQISGAGGVASEPIRRASSSTRGSSSSLDVTVRLRLQRTVQENFDARRSTSRSQRVPTHCHQRSRQWPARLRFFMGSRRSSPGTASKRGAQTAPAARVIFAPG